MEFKKFSRGYTLGPLWQEVSKPPPAPLPHGCAMHWGLRAQPQLHGNRLNHYPQDKFKGLQPTNRLSIERMQALVDRFLDRLQFSIQKP